MIRQTTNAPTATQLLRRGSRGAEVKLLQQRIRDLVPVQQQPRGQRISDDGSFGKGTQQVVKAFQRIRQQRNPMIEVHGVVDGPTWNALGVRFNGSATAGIGNPVTHITGVGSLEEELLAPWMQIARIEMNVHKVHEIKGDLHHPRVLDYFKACPKNTHKAGVRASHQKDESAWCSAFVNWCLKQTGVIGSQSSWAASFNRWGDPADGLTFGAITTIHSSLAASGFHVAFLAGADRRYVYLLGGNQVGRLDDGSKAGMARVKPYLRKDVAAMRVPKGW